MAGTSVVMVPCVLAEVARKALAAVVRKVPVVAGIAVAEQRALPCRLSTDCRSYHYTL